MLNAPDRERASRALAALYERFAPALSAFAAQRLSGPDPETLERVLSRFWEELAENGLPEDGQDYWSGVQSRLFFALSRIVDRENKGRGNPDKAVLTDKDYEALYSGRLTEEEQKVQEQHRALMARALLLLAQIDPEDARLAWLHYKGMGFPEIAETLLAGRPASQEEKDRLAERLKERFFRPRTGARARLAALLQRLANQKNAEPAG